MMRRCEFHPEASLDIDEIWTYIAKDNLDAADRVVAEMQAAIDKALPFPQVGHLRPDLVTRPLRLLHVYDYLIAYIFDTERLLVLAVLHGRRDPDKLASILREREQ